MVFIGQSRAPPAITTTLARPTPLASSQSLAQHPGTCDLTVNQLIHTHRPLRRGMEDFESSARSWRQRTAGCRSRRRFVGWEGQRFEPVSRQGRKGPLQWWPQFWGRQHSTASADMEFDSLESNTTLTPTRRCDQMLSVHVAAGGGILLHTARQLTPSVPSVQGTTKR